MNPPKEDACQGSFNLDYLSPSSYSHPKLMLSPSKMNSRLFLYDEKY